MTINMVEGMHCDNSPKDFIEARETGFPLVDKSMLIGSILNDRVNKVLLFCRPHCYGKSLNLSMLDAFLNVEHRGNHWFDGMSVSFGAGYDGVMNSFPVIRLDLGSVPWDDPDRVERSIAELTRSAFLEHRYIETSDHIPDYRRSDYFRVAFGESRDIDVVDLPGLSEMLHKHHGVPAVVLVDGYDVPAISSLGGCGHRTAVELTGRMLSFLLKDNPHVKKAVLTGVYRVLYPGLTNLSVNSPLEGNSRHSQFFGLIREEVGSLCECAGHPDAVSEITDLFGGFNVSGTEVFSPYGVMRHLEGCDCSGPQPTSAAPEEIACAISGEYQHLRGILEKLVEGEHVVADLDTPIRLPETGMPSDMGAGSILAMMVYAGFLSVDPEGRRELRIPNQVAGCCVERLLRILA